MKHEEKLKFIIAVLDQFGNSTCDYCERQRHWRDYIFLGDIEKWLDKRQEEPQRGKFMARIIRVLQPIPRKLTPDTARVRDIERVDCSHRKELKHWKLEAEIWKELYTRELIKEALEGSG